MNRIRPFQYWLLVAFLLPAPLLAQAASSACDPSIRQNPDHPQGYRNRDGELCEGIYATEVSSLGLTLASFTGPMNNIDMTSEAQLHFRWQSIGQGNVRLRADSLRPRLYYRMDAVRPANQAQLSWTNAIPAQYKLRTGEFGALATQEDSSGNLVYLPLTISQDTQAPPGTPYVVTVISGAEIDEIYWSLTMEGTSERIVWDQPLDRKPYAANQPIAIQLDQVVKPGRYLLMISAELLNGSEDTVEIPFYHSP